LTDDDEHKETLELLQSYLSTLILPENPNLIEAGKCMERIVDIWSAASLGGKRELTRILRKSIAVNLIDERITGITPIDAFSLMLDEGCEDLQVLLLESKKPEHIVLAILQFISGGISARSRSTSTGS